jgi:transposase
METISKSISQNSYMITDEGNVIGFFDVGEEGSKGAHTILIGEDTEIVKSMSVTKQVIYDAVHKSKSQFSDKYSSEMNKQAPLTAKQYYDALRSYIVDNKTPIPKKSTKAKTSKAQPKASGSKLTRKDQVRQLLDQGTTSSSKIAEELCTNASYVARLVKQIKNEGSN